VEITITESEYLAILRWDEDGGAAYNVVYRIIPDPISATSRATSGSPLKNHNMSEDETKSPSKLETVGV
jgi:hypothetical protein